MSIVIASPHTRENRKYYANILFILLSLANLFVLSGNNGIINFFVGELIIFLFIWDLTKTEYKFHIYQILLFYFYYSIPIVSSFSTIPTNEYSIYGYLVNVLHLLFLVIGYNLYGYKHGRYVVKNKQNPVVLAYFIMTIFFAILSLYGFEQVRDYADSFRLSAEESRSNLNIYSYIFGGIYGYITNMAIFSLSNPYIYSLSLLLNNLIGYVSSGVKGGVIGPVVVFIFLYQVYFKKISIKQLIVYIPVSILLLAFLISTTMFRNVLSLDSLLNLKFSEMKWFLTYFLVSPESSHISYTTNIIKMIDESVIDFRYGFDFYRHILYPFKDIFHDFGYASFVKYYHLVTGVKGSGGFYLGMAGELYWNFGPFFVFISFLLGILLKWFTNWAFSLSMLGIISYVILAKTVLWIYYRGIALELMMNTVIYTTAIIIFVVGLKFLNSFLRSVDFDKLKYNLFYVTK